MFYFPIILASYWYPKKGLLFSVGIASAYGIMAFSLIPAVDPSLIIATAIRMAFFILIGGIVALLSLRLRESEQQLHDIIEFLPDATFAIDTHGRVIAWNRAIEEMTGRKKEGMIGQGDYAYAEPFYGKRRPVLIDLILNPGSMAEGDYPLINRHGTWIESEIFIPRLRNGKGIHLKVTATALVDSNGKVCGALESIRDITDNILTETALRNTSSRLNTIAGIIRLDLSRTLTVLYGHLSLGVMKFDDSRFISFIDEIRHSVKGVQQQIDMSRVFRDIGTTPPDWMPVQGAVSDAVKRLGCPNVTFGIWTERLEVFADPNLSVAFYQILYYYLKKGTRPAQMVITYHISDNQCRILIEDRGPGISVVDKEILFTQWNDRSGFGLYLAHEILGITGMTIHETGVFLEGVRFEILLPAGAFRVIGENEKIPLIGITPIPSEPVRPQPLIPAILDNLPVVRELRTDEFLEADALWYEYHETKGVPGTDRIFGVFLGPVIVSLARCRKHPDGMEVDGIFTPDKNRNKGYSRMAVRALVEACHNDDLYMHAVLHLTGFYRTFGFLPIEEKILPPTIRERYTWAAGNLEGAQVQPMYRKHSL
jgi:PAS domain S-box-containing protein